MSEEAIRLKNEKEDVKASQDAKSTSMEPYTDSITELEESIHPSSLSGINKDKKHFDPNTPEDLKNIVPNISVSETWTSNKSEDSPQAKDLCLANELKGTIVTSSESEKSKKLGK